MIGNAADRFTARRSSATRHENRRKVAADKAMYKTY
jgi:hypothetical protein